MDAAEFETLAEETLENLFDSVEDMLGLDEDADFAHGILNIELGDGRKYVINKNSASQEIWVSSPVSGASHYAFDADSGDWLNTRGGGNLVETLSTELSRLTGNTVSLG
ncbi:MAG: iron donor protein CyaY [Alphaproteobacteria bacterium]|nr:iron donor protein CyaY [Alphaproteobacteria bacterium]MBF0249307.1 iron donor protein CyaY [Alphaproteobacteria bacterium]